MSIMIASWYVLTCRHLSQVRCHISFNSWKWGWKTDLVFTMAHTAWRSSSSCLLKGFFPQNQHVVKQQFNPLNALHFYLSVLLSFLSKSKYLPWLRSIKSGTSLTTIIDEFTKQTLNVSNINLNGCFWDMIKGKIRMFYLQHQEVLFN